MSKFSEKYQLIKQVIKNDECMLISHKDKVFSFACASNDEMFQALYHRLLEFVPSWKRQWNVKNKAKK